MKSNFTWTIASCLVVMLVAVSLYVNKMTTKVHLSSEQLKDMGLYLIEPPRNLGAFNLMIQLEKSFCLKILKASGTCCFLVSLFVQISAP